MTLLRTARRTRQAWHYVLAAALLLAQWAGIAHGFEHVRYEFALAHYVALAQQTHQVAGAAASQPADDGAPPALDHSRDRCVVFHALDCVAVSAAQPVLASATRFVGLSDFVVVPRAADAPPFSSRAPPILS
jgi:hypothetical protein